MDDPAGKWFPGFDSCKTMLREHISKENDILYPISLEVIPEEIVWQNMKKECDKIGYCCFTPKI